ncbi:BTAD domain-containing putative transcriptional regulator [Ovoidimarina sediminis]|uniref:BTAD domain-containing putative transcriptional regulator n=1 Tax=Ovoidimarina sediminis TaxID=3079856 RepID=UPI0029142FD1|nr:BTAD domain-containing putative transcriptional regulator [Rhodophyticola sp. MJ-SS7]MDU8942770.1 BTAD domain-containing putative transcriptional regulator [Rhodophyticola sp. MJ-SS7]
MLGPFTVRAGGQPVPAPPKKAGALLAYLARRPGVAVPRETLAALLWAESGEDQARGSLRQALSALRRGLGDGAGAIVADGAAVTLDTGRAALDVAGFEAAAEQDPKAALALYGGPFLEGFGPVSPEFDRWAEAERSHLEALFAATLLKETDRAEAEGRGEDMAALAARLLSIDPLQEHVHRRLMRAHLRAGRHDAALRQFNELTRVLSAELGVTPEKPTLDLVAEIRAARAGRGAAAAPAPVPVAPGAPEIPGRPSVAVLPFRALSTDEEAAFFGEGIAEDVIIELSRNKSLMTVARQSSFRFSEEETGAEEIGRQLGVRFLLGGSVRIAGARVRVAAHLVRCDSGREIWAERFDRELTDIFDIQTEIARTVTATVVGQIEEEEISGAQGRPAEGLEAHLLILRATRAADRISRESFAEATGHLERAIAIEPGNARALGLLALLKVYDEWYFEIGQNVGPAVELAGLALKHDPREPKAHCALGVALTIARDFETASHHFQAGRNANPNDAQLLVEYGRHLMYADRPEDGIRTIREAMRLNPFHPSWYWSMIGRCLHTLGRFDEAVEAFRRMEEPPFYVHAYLASCLTMLGDEAGAARAREALYAMRPDFSLESFARIFPYRNPETAERFFGTFRAAGIV